MKKFLLFLTLTVAGSAIGQSDNVAQQGYVSDADYPSEINSNEFTIVEGSKSETVQIKSKERMAQARIYVLDMQGYVVKRVNSINGFSFELNTAAIKPGKYTVRLINGTNKYDEIWVKK